MAGTQGVLAGGRNLRQEKPRFIALTLRKNKVARFSSVQSAISGGNLVVSGASRNGSRRMFRNIGLNHHGN